MTLVLGSKQLMCFRHISELSNKTNIALVSKKKSPTKMTEFKPINLSNVTYKIIAKVLSNKLKAVLPQIITENQSAFLFERLITDNILVAFEIIHYVNNK